MGGGNKRSRAGGRKLGVRGTSLRRDIVIGRASVGRRGDKSPQCYPWGNGPLKPLEEENKRRFEEAAEAFLGRAY